MAVAVARPLARRLLKWTLRVLAVPLVLLAVIVLAFAVQTRVRHADLQPWHRLELHEEFHAGRAGVESFEDYLALEDRLFAELRTRVLGDPQASDPFVLGKYHAGSAPASRAWDTPYNRSFELKPPDPRGAVLLVHGLSDSPYSMRALAGAFFAEGYHVVALRLPGHGTLPSMLRDVSWRDWYAAVTLAARYTAAQAGPGEPFLAGGHSTGSALLALYSVRSLRDASLPRPQRLYLMSPAIGIDDFAVLTNVISALSIVPYFEKSEWLDVYPEYDPYKYNSFPVNAGNQIYHVTRELRAALDEAAEAGTLRAMPRITVFHSLMDATVKTVDVVRNLLARLPGEGNELVVFDVNRHAFLEGLLAEAPIAYLDRIRQATDLTFRVTLVGNRDSDTGEIGLFSRAPGEREVTLHGLPLAWPPGVYSLGHVAIPFPVDDPVYGLAPADDGAARFPLGAFPARGETGALRVPPALLARLRSNPFFDVIRAKVVETCRTDEADLARRTAR